MANVQHPNPDPPAAAAPVNDPQPAAQPQLVPGDAGGAAAPLVQVNQQEFERMKEELRTLKESVESVTKGSVESIIKRILAYMSRPLTEFNKYEVLEMLETLLNTASDSHHEKSNYYRLVHQTARKNIDLPKPHFHSLLLRLIGDKDHEKILDVETKVAKVYRLEVSRQRRDTSIPYRRGTERYSRANTITCYACGKSGHVRATCPDRGSVTEKPSTKDTQIRKE